MTRDAEPAALAEALPDARLVTIPGTHMSSVTQPEMGEALAAFLTVLDGFSLAARANVAHRTPGAMGLRDLRIIEAIYASAKQGGARVELRL